MRRRLRLELSAKSKWKVNIEVFQIIAPRSTPSWLQFFISFSDSFVGEFLILAGAFEDNSIITILYALFVLNLYSRFGH
jgi:hypothetical protein